MYLKVELNVTKAQGKVTLDIYIKKQWISLYKRLKQTVYI